MSKPQGPAQRARNRFEQIVSRRDEHIDLAEAALWLAAEAYTELDVAHWLRQIDALADEQRDATLSALPGERGASLLAGLTESGFRGDHDGYYDPRNSFLNEVLDRRLGIPITLSVVYVEVARRLGLDADGISFPGHFLAKVTEAGSETIVDPFEGRIVSQDECRERLHAVLGPSAVWTPDVLRAARPREILVRMLTNLKAIYAGRQDFEQALGCSDRILLLAPNSALEIRDRGLFYRALDFVRPARSDLERFLEIAPEHESAEAIRQVLAGLRGREPTVH